MKIRLCIALCAVSTLAMPNTAWAKNEKTWATVSDVGLYGLSALAIGLPIAKRDKQGAFQAAGSIGAASLITTGLKEIFPERRPDGSNRKSFPSGLLASPSRLRPRSITAKAKLLASLPSQSQASSESRGSRPTSISIMMCLLAQASASPQVSSSPINDRSAAPS
jgi:hypothetical protein